MIGLFLELFTCFFLIGLFTFGGGYAVIGMIQSEVVIAKGWLSESAFTDIVAISQITPGPVGLNCSTYVGYEVLRTAGAGEAVSCLGSFVASIAVVLPSFLVMLLLVRFYSRFHTRKTFSDVMDCLRPAVAGLIGAAALVLMMQFDSGNGISILTENFPDWKAWALFAAAFISYLLFNAGPIPILITGALLGILIYRP